MSLTSLYIKTSAPLLTGIGAWGEGVFGSDAFGGEPGPDVLDFLPKVILASISYSRGINGAIGTLTFSMRLPWAAPGIAVGAAITLNSTEGVEFTGYVCRMVPTKLSRDATSLVLWRFSCQDDTRLLELTSTGIERFDGEADDYTIAYLFGKYLPSMDVTQVQQIIASMPSMDLSGKTLRQCLEDISKITLGIWYVEPGMVLQYHASYARTAPFSLAEDGDKISTEPMRMASCAVTVEFSKPCNSAEVRNIPNDEVLEEVCAPGVSGDDGFTTLNDVVYPPTGTATADTDNNSIRVERSRIHVDATPEDHDYTPGSDGTLAMQWSGCPPGGSVAVSGGATINVGMTKSGDQYAYQKAAMGFDTTAIPDDAEILNATLTLKDCGSMEFDPGGKVYAAWLDNPSYKTVVDSSDWGYVDNLLWGDTSALGHTDIAGLTGTQVFGLSNPALGVQKTKRSWLLMAMYSGATPPTGLNFFSFSSSGSGANAPVLTVTYRMSTETTYTVACALVQFDTSVLPVDAEVVSATLQLKPSLAPVNADQGEVGVEWYPASNWPIGAADYTNTPSKAAGGYKPLSAVALDTPVSFSLSAAAANVNLTGYTGLRIHVHLLVAATPTGENSVEFYSKDSAGVPAQLVINYISAGSIVGIANNLISQGLYGVFKRVVLNSSLTSQAEADLQAEALIAVGALPEVAIKTTISRSGLTPGSWVQVNFPAFQLNRSFLIRALSVSLEGKNPVYTVDVGDFRPDMIEFLRQQAARLT